jgi:hypothetical protein
VVKKIPFHGLFAEAHKGNEDQNHESRELHEWDDCELLNTVKAPPPNSRPSASLEEEEEEEEFWNTNLR